jgi:hypothetical protein
VARLINLANRHTCRRKRGSATLEREDYYPTLVALALRFGPYFRVTGKRHVNDSTFCRRHRLEAILATAGADSSSRSACKPTQHLNPTLSVVFDIDYDIRFSTELTVSNHSDQELQRLQRLATSTNQQSGVLSLDLEGHRAVFFVFTNVRLSNDTHCTEEIVNQI